MKITEVYDDSGEWSAVYLDNEIICQGHSINLHDVLYALQMNGIIEFESIEKLTDDRYPYFLNEIE